VLIGVPSAATQDIFDPASGRLLVENNAGAQPQRTYVYLNGMPIALVSGFSSINYVLSDQLGQPQKLVAEFSTLVWDRMGQIGSELIFLRPTLARPRRALGDRRMLRPGRYFLRDQPLHVIQRGVTVRMKAWPQRGMSGISHAAHSPGTSIKQKSEPHWAMRQPRTKSPSFDASRSETAQKRMPFSFQLRVL
jgi:hypothetical protein